MVVARTLETLASVDAGGLAPCLPRSARTVASGGSGSASCGPEPVTDLFGVEGRRLLKRLQVPEPRRGNITASIELIDFPARRSSLPEATLSSGGLTAHAPGFRIASPKQV